MKIDSVVDRAKQFIEKCIITGQLTLEQQIREQEIASELEISKAPVREAFKILGVEDLVM